MDRKLRILRELAEIEAESPADMPVEEHGRRLRYLELCRDDPDFPFLEGEFRRAQLRMQMQTGVSLKEYERGDELTRLRVDDWFTTAAGKGAKEVMDKMAAHLDKLWEQAGS